MITRNPSDLPAGRILGLDGGSKRVGIAISDSGGRLATAAGAHPRQPWQALKAHLLTWKDKGVVAVAVGFPLNMDGSEGPAANAARSLADLVAKDCNLPVLLWDERLTSTQAEAAFFEQRSGRQTRGSKKDSVGRIDSAAATLMLQSVLDAQKMR